VVEIEAGRHPVIDLLLTEGEQFVANDTKMRVSYLAKGTTVDTKMICVFLTELGYACHDNYRTKHGRKELLYQTSVQLLVLQIQPHLVYSQNFL
jgi:hypothetical protein